MNFLADKLNIFLIVVAAILAYWFPLELFIFAYAILGPLHYVTEINWLNDKKFFFTTKSRIWLWVGIISSLIIFVPSLYLEYGNPDSGPGRFMAVVGAWSNSAIFMSLMLAIGYQFIHSKIGWIIISAIGMLGAILLQGRESYDLIIGLFVPTIIHVYLFTMIFMLYGARKSKSIYGYLSVLLALAIPLVYINLTVQPDMYNFSAGLKTVYLENNFHLTPVLFSKFIGLSEGNSFYFYESLELKLMMFMSFIYLYHYLNWFSKTTVIKWHKMLNRKKSILIVCIWILSLSAYAVNFKFGFLISLFLSFLHVILEFPLNMLSIKGLLMPARTS